MTSLVLSVVKIKIGGLTMNDTDIIKVRNLLQNKFLNNNITIYIQGAIEFTFPISNLQFFISKTLFILSDGKNHEIKIEVYWIDNIKIENDYILLYMER